MKNKFLKISLLLGFSTFFLLTVITGSVDMYVHPRIIPYLIFSSISMIIISMFLLKNLFKSDKKERTSISLFFFIIPLVMAFALPADYFTSKVEVVEEIQLLPDIIVTENDEKSKTYNDFEEKAEIEKAEIEEAEIEEIEETEAMEEDFSEEIVMTSKNFYKVISEIYSDMNYYNGVSIKTVGFVFKGDGMFEDNQFVPARLMMICCAADMQPVGLLCVYDKALELEEDSWVQVQGTISITEFEGEYVPCIIAEEVKKEDAPDKQYIYPY